MNVERAVRLSARETPASTSFFKKCHFAADRSRVPLSSYHLKEVLCIRTALEDQLGPSCTICRLSGHDAYLPGQRFDQKRSQRAFQDRETTLNLQQAALEWVSTSKMLDCVHEVVAGALHNELLGDYKLR